MKVNSFALFVASQRWPKEEIRLSAWTPIYLINRDAEMGISDPSGKQGNFVVADPLSSTSPRRQEHNCECSCFVSAEYIDIVLKKSRQCIDRIREVVHEKAKQEWVYRWVSEGFLLYLSKPPKNQAKSINQLEMRQRVLLNAAGAKQAVARFPKKNLLNCLSWKLSQETFWFWWVKIINWQKAIRFIWFRFILIGASRMLTLITVRVVLTLPYTLHWHQDCTVFSSLLDEYHTLPIPPTTHNHGLVGTSMFTSSSQSSNGKDDENGAVANWNQLSMSVVWSPLFDSLQISDSPTRRLLKHL